MHYQNPPSILNQIKKECLSLPLVEVGLDKFYALLVLLAAITLNGHGLTKCHMNPTGTVDGAEIPEEFNPTVAPEICFKCRRNHFYPGSSCQFNSQRIEILRVKV